MAKTLDDFWTLLVGAADKDLQHSPLLRTAAFDVMRERNSFGPELVGETLTRARQLRQKYALPRDTKEAGSTLKPEAATPGDLLTAEQLARKLEPWARALRLERFGTEVVPFSPEDAPASTTEKASWAIEKAADWIEHESEAQLSQSTTKPDARKPKEELYRAASKFAEETGLDVNVEISRRILRYQRPDPDDLLDVYTTSVYTARGSFLYKLACAAQRIAEYTGVTQDVLIVYILTGLYPVRPRVWASQGRRSMRLPCGEHISTRWKTLTFYAADLTDKDLRNAYADVRTYVGGKGTKSLDLEDVDFWRLVEHELGGPPNEHGTMKPFWKEAQHRWNSEYASVHKSYTHYTRWEGVRRKYKSLAGRLQSGF